jgi:hypothetical protein
MRSASIARTYKQELSHDGTMRKIYDPQTDALSVTPLG